MWSGQLHLVDSLRSSCLTPCMSPFAQSPCYHKRFTNIPTSSARSSRAHCIVFTIQEASSRQLASHFGSLLVYCSHYSAQLDNSPRALDFRFQHIISFQCAPQDGRTVRNMAGRLSTVLPRRRASVAFCLRAPLSGAQQTRPSSARAVPPSGRYPKQRRKHRR